MHTRYKVCKYVAGRNDQSENPSVIYEYNQDAIFLAKNRQVDICTKNIDICNHFLQDMVEENYIDVQYIPSEDNPADIMTKNTSKEYFSSHI